MIYLFSFSACSKSPWESHLGSLIAPKGYHRDKTYKEHGQGNETLCFHGDVERKGNVEGDNQGLGKLSRENLQKEERKKNKFKKTFLHYYHGVKRTVLSLPQLQPQDFFPFGMF